MTTINAGLGRVLAGAGGAALIAALFLPWAADRDGWETLAAADVLLVATAATAVAAAVTGGRYGFFRPDVSLSGAADIFGVVSATAVGWWIAFEVPGGASAQAGGYLALAGGVAVACGAGDFRVPSLFPRLERPPHARRAD